MKSIYEDNEWLAIRANTEENVNLINSLINDPDDYVEIDEDPVWETTVLVRSKEKNSNFIFLFEYMKPDEYREGLNYFDVDIELLKKQFPNELIGFFYSCGMRPEESFTERMKYTDFFTDGDYAFAYCVGDVCGLKDFKVPSRWTSLKDMFYEAKPEGDIINLSGWNVRNVRDFSKIFYLSTFKRIVLDGWCIDSHVTNFKDMFNGYTLRELSLRNWQLSLAIDEYYNLEGVDDYFMSNGYVIHRDRDINDSLTIDISGCDKHTAICLLSRLMYGYNWDIKFVIDEQSEVKEMYESFIQLIIENDQFSLSDRTSKRREEYLSKLHKFLFFKTADVDEMDFACDGYWKKYLDVEDWRIRSCFRKR